MADRKPQQKSPKCKECMKSMKRAYVYMKINKKTNWRAIGWVCVDCKNMMYDE